MVMGLFWPILGGFEAISEGMGHFGLSWVVLPSSQNYFKVA